MEIKRLVVGEIEANCYILISGNEICVIDPGDEAGRIIAELKKTEGKLKYIIDTHFHFDHVTANDQVKNECGGEILIHEKEKEFLDFVPDRFLVDNEILKVGNDTLTVVHTPGHSEGSICLLHDCYIFTGDTVFLNGHGRVDLVGGSMDDLVVSLKKLNTLIKPGMIVYPGHGDCYKNQI